MSDDANRMCSKCGISKVETEFYRSDKRTCKACCRVKGRQWYEANRHKKLARSKITGRKFHQANRERRILQMKARMYGISVEKVAELLRDQRCAICNEHRPDLQIDHCHNTGHVRGALCPRCNVMLGAARDDIAVLKAAVGYLGRGAVESVSEGCVQKSKEHSTNGLMWDLFENYCGMFPPEEIDGSIPGRSRSGHGLPDGAVHPVKVQYLLGIRYERTEFEAAVKSGCMPGACRWRGRMIFHGKTVLNWARCLPHLPRERVARFEAKLQHRQSLSIADCAVRDTNLLF